MTVSLLTLGIHHICNGLRGRNGPNEVFCNPLRHGSKAWPQRFECLKHRPASNVILTIGRKLATMSIGTVPKRPYKRQECPVLASAFSFFPAGVLVRNPASGECHCAHHVSRAPPCPLSPILHKWGREIQAVVQQMICFPKFSSKNEAPIIGKPTKSTAGRVNSCLKFFKLPRHGRRYFSQARI